MSKRSTRKCRHLVPVVPRTYGDYDRRNPDYVKNMREALAAGLPGDTTFSLSAGKPHTSWSSESTGSKEVE